MSRPDESRRLREDLAFFGRVTASTTHQINNVLAILGELDGLLEDLSQAAQDGASIPPEKLADVLARSQRQIQRGVDYVDRLNAFAHAVDSPEAAIDVAEAVTGLAALAGRMAQLKRAALTCTTDGPVELTTRPFRLLRAVHLAIEAALVGAGKGRQVAVAVRRPGGAAGGGGDAGGGDGGDGGDGGTDEPASAVARGRKVEIEIVSSEPLAPGEPTERLLAALAGLAVELGGDVGVEVAPAGRIRLRLGEAG